LPDPHAVATHWMHTLPDLPATPLMASRRRTKSLSLDAQNLRRQQDADDRRTPTLPLIRNSPLGRRQTASTCSAPSPPDCKTTATASTGPTHAMPIQQAHNPTGRCAELYVRRQPSAAHYQCALAVANA